MAYHHRWSSFSLVFPGQFEICPLNVTVERLIIVGPTDTAFREFWYSPVCDTPLFALTVQDFTTFTMTLQLTESTASDVFVLVGLRVMEGHWIYEHDITRHFGIPQSDTYGRRSFIWVIPDKFPCFQASLGQWEDLDERLDDQTASKTLGLWFGRMGSTLVARYEQAPGMPGMPAFRQQMPWIFMERWTGWNGKTCQEFVKPDKQIGRIIQLRPFCLSKFGFWVKAEKGWPWIFSNQGRARSGVFPTRSYRRLLVWQAPWLKASNFLETVVTLW